MSPIIQTSAVMGYIEIAREKVAEGRFYLSHHAQIERGEEKIRIDDIVEAILNGQELEPYPDDPRGESCLIVGQGLDYGRPFYQEGIKNGNMLFLQ